MADHPRDIFFFSSARTTSNLLVQLMSEQPDYSHKEYHFHDPFIWYRLTHEGTPIVDLTAEQREEYVSQMRAGYERLLKERAEAKEAGKSCFFKNHTSQVYDPTVISQQLFGGEKAETITLSDNKPPKTNPTLFSDDFLRTWTPVFLIRHPAQIVESFYRAENRVRPLAIPVKEHKFYTTLQYSREVYDWYAKNTDIKPIIIEADDLMEGGETIERLCAATGLDADKVLYSWDSKDVSNDPSLNVFTKSYLAGLHASTGIDKSKMAKGLTIDGKYLQWQNEWGVEVADYLKDLVDCTIDDYKYMYANRI